MGAQAMVGSNIAAAAAGIKVNKTEAHDLCSPESQIVVWPAAGLQAFAAYHQGPNTIELKYVRAQ